MAELFATGRIIDVILVLVVLEAVGLVILWRWTRRGVAPREAAANLVSGGALMLAVRAALTGAPWTSVSGWLLLAFAAHVADLWYRWRS